MLCRRNKLEPMLSLSQITQINPSQSQLLANAAKIDSITREVKVVRLIMKVRPLSWMQARPPFLISSPRTRTRLSQTRITITRSSRKKSPAILSLLKKSTSRLSQMSPKSFRQSLVLSFCITSPCLQVSIAVRSNHPH